MRGVKGGITVEFDGLVETLKAVRGVQEELRPQANGEIRDAAGACAGELLPYLTAAATSSGVPVAPRVARAMSVHRDRLPSVYIGGSTPVGRHGAPAAALVWGSEQGPKSEPNHFGVAPSSGYWIAPAVAAFQSGPALEAVSRGRRCTPSLGIGTGLL